ncbi:Variant surface glycoprotein [Trypanosoma congolense IL3000]|uniref:Variant surface glycoprotein n=1 Tax=Trypanosoma congolense (strain IL3000) TaxID=1068625 RepID=F9W747_TRYCI|nr:Variant surface glycoprotein [Trypanosoma congolense IL3000]
MLFSMKMLMIVTAMGVVMGSGYNKDLFKTLCGVLKSAERVVNRTDWQTEQLKEAIYWRSRRVLTVENGKVIVKGTCNGHVNRAQLCTYYTGGKYGCFAESLGGALLCTCAPGNGMRGRDFCGMGHLQNDDTWSGGGVEGRSKLFHEVWDKVREKCFRGNDIEKSITEEVSNLEKAANAFRGKIRQGKQNFFYLGEKVGPGYCSGSSPNDVCAAYYGRRTQVNSVHIPWLRKILDSLNNIKNSPTQTAVQKENLPSQIFTHTASNSPAPAASAGGSGVTSGAREESVKAPQEASSPTQKEHAPSPVGDETHTLPPHSTSESKSRKRRATKADHDSTQTDQPQTPDPTDKEDDADDQVEYAPLADDSAILKPIQLILAAIF